MNPAYIIPSSDGSPFDLADSEYAQLKSDLVSAAWRTLSQGQAERQLAERVRPTVCQLLQAYVSLRSQAEPIEVVAGANGLERTHVRLQEQRNMMSTFGPIAILRTAYSGRGLSSLHPIDADLNLPSHSFSLELERAVARAATDLSFEGTSAFIAANTSAKVAKRQVESITRRASADFHAFYKGREWRPISQADTGPFLILSFDQIGVVVRTSELRGRTRKIAEGGTERFRAVHNRDGKRHWRGRKRLATVAAVYTIQPDCRTPDDVVRGLRRLQDVTNRKHQTVRPELKRVWASVEQEPQTVIDEAFDEALKRDPDQSKEWFVLIDGDPDLRKWVLRAAKQRGVKVTLVLDIIHVLQYLWAAGQNLCGSDNAEIEAWVLPRLTRIPKGEVGNAIAGMTRAATRRGLKPRERAAIDKCADYCLKRKKLMRYGTLLAAGAPIATGAIEGTCKHLIATRCDKSGARWSIRGADAVLRLRALQLSGDFDEYWDYHEAQEQFRNHACRYARSVVPKMATPDHKTTRSHLSIAGSRRSKCATPRAA